MQTGADELLILHNGAVPFDDDAAVKVTGTVQKRFDVVEAERFVGGDLDDGLFGSWNGEPYIPAQTVELIQASD